MKSTGISRQLDSLGRVVIPKELRNTMHIDSHDLVSIFTESNRIILEKYEVECIICGGSEELSDYKGKKVCVDCIIQLDELTV